MNLIQVGVDCLSDLDTNVKDGYECNDGLWIWYRLGLIVYLIWILILRMDTNVMMDCECDTGWGSLFIGSGYLDTGNLKDNVSM